jgi:hypothetical protein
VHDGGALEGLLAPIAAVCADKAYDSFDCHAAILAREAQPVIPPYKGVGGLTTVPKTAPATSGRSLMAARPEAFVVAPGSRGAAMPRAGRCIARLRRSARVPAAAACTVLALLAPEAAARSGRT